MFEGKSAVILDMNGTFMFGEDRFGPTENYFAHYETLGGRLSRSVVNSSINAAYRFLEQRYVDPVYHECFPSVSSAFQSVCPDVSAREEERLVETFAAHEIGEIDSEHVDAITNLATKYRLGAVIDIWSPRKRWHDLFATVGLAEAFSAISFSSEHGVVKPSAIPYLRVMSELGVKPNEAIFVGDSIRRDLGGALAAGIDCILVGGAQDPRAFASVPSLLELVNG